MKKILSLVFLAAFVMNCAPRDIHTETAKDRLERGEVVHASEFGGRLPGCPSDKEDWDEARLYSDDESAYEKLVVASLKGTKTHLDNYVTGTYNCLREGSVVNAVAGNPFKKVGRLKVEDILMVKWKVLQENTRKVFESRGDKGEFVTRSLSKNTLEKMPRLLKPEHHGVVTIVKYSYVKGSDRREKLLAKKLSPDNIEIVKAGDRLSTCPDGWSDWSDVRIPREYHQGIIDGKMKSWVVPGNLNCLRVDPDKIVDLTMGKDSPSCAKLKVTGVTKMPLNKVSETDVELGDLDFVDFMNGISDRMEDKHEGQVNITHLEFVPGTSTGTICDN